MPFTAIVEEAEVVGAGGFVRAARGRSSCLWSFSFLVCHAPPPAPRVIFVRSGCVWPHRTHTYAHVSSSCGAPPSCIQDQCGLCSEFGRTVSCPFDLTCWSNQPHSPPTRVRVHSKLRSASTNSFKEVQLTLQSSAAGTNSHRHQRDKKQPRWQSCAPSFFCNPSTTRVMPQHKAHV